MSTRTLEITTDSLKNGLDALIKGVSDTRNGGLILTRKYSIIDLPTQSYPGAKQLQTNNELLWDNSTC